jgi:hypothetical protein
MAMRAGKSMVFVIFSRKALIYENSYSAKSLILTTSCTAMKRRCSGRKAATSAGRSPNIRKFGSSRVGTACLRKRGFTFKSSRIPTWARARARTASGQIDSASRLRLDILFSYHSSKAMNSSPSTSICRLTPVRRPSKVSWLLMMSD